jgi:sugar/nucleoside kinase (ribokinase family)
LRFFVLGDVAAEIAVKVPDDFWGPEPDMLLRVPMELEVGGTAGNFAVAAAEDPDAHVSLLSCLGDDPLGEALVRRLGEHGVHAITRFSSSAPTPVILYVVRSPPRHGRRLLIARANANHDLSVGDVRKAEGDIAQARCLVSDTYSMRTTERREATAEAMRLAHQRGVSVVCDIVPHDCFRHVRLEDLTSFTRHADVLVIEARTLNCFLGEPWAVSTSRPDAERASDRARRTFPGRTVLLRFGLGNADRTLVVLPDGETYEYGTGYATATTPRGFGERLLVRELKILLGVSVVDLRASMARLVPAQDRESAWRVGEPL